MRRAILLALAIAAAPPIVMEAHAMDCSSNTLSKDAAVVLQTQLFSAMANEDRELWKRLTASDFVAFERGKQYGSDAFFDLIAGAHKAGFKFVWSVTEPRVEAGCNLVVMSYVNSGSIAEKDSAPKPTRWLESVAFRKDGGGWRAFLVTSMRAEAAS